MQRRLRLGFHGVPNAGKTALHTILYRLRAFKGGRLSFDDDEPTKQYLTACMNDLREHRTVRANAMAKPDRLRWRLILANKDVWEVEAMDFAGALVEAGSDAASQFLSQEVLTFLAECDALFLLLDCVDPDFRQMDALDLLLTHLGRRRTAHGSKRRPIALVWTKIDKLGPIDPDPEVNLQKIRQRIGQHHVFETIQNILEQENEEEHLFKQFPVSTFGWTAHDGLAPPLDQIRPYGIFEPLVWAATASAGVIEENQEEGLNQARRQIQEIRKRRWPFQAPDFVAMEKVYHDLLPASEIDHPHLAAAVKADLAAIHRERSRRRLKKNAVKVCLLAAALFAGWFALHTQACNRFDQVMQFRSEHRDDKDLAQRRERTERLLGSVWSWSFLMGQERQERLKQGLAEDVEIDYWLRERKEREAIEVAAKTMKQDGKATDLYARCGTFAEQFGRSKHRSRIEELREQARQLWRDDTWARATSAEAQSPSDYARIRDLYKACLKVPSNEKARDAEEAVGRIERNWDSAAYSPLQQAMQSPRSWADLTKAEQLIGPYLKGERGVKKMQEQVKTLEKWFSELRSGRIQMDIDLELEIPWRSTMVVWVGEDRITLTASMAGRTISTVFNRSNRGFGQDSVTSVAVGKLPIAWGQNTVSFHLKHRQQDKDRTSGGTVTLSDLFSGRGKDRGYFSNSVTVNCKWNCPALNISTRHLPPYGP
jgi:hypothetical protein